MNDVVTKSTDRHSFGVATSTTVPLRIAGEKTGRLDQFNERLSEWCSSILVKETRQSLKSRQFLWTYFLLLGAVGLWTTMGIAFRDYDFEVTEMGRDLLYGLFVIMGFPLGIIIPFGAYRSLAREYEDGTIQLISITTMNPAQIIIGKFGSAILQMLVYLSVLAPCILFTYLLRGVSLPQIGWGLAMCVGFSIFLTILGLFLAGAIRSRALSVGISVLFVLLLGWLYYLWCLIADELLGSSFSGFNDPEFTFVFFGMVSFFGSTALLLLVTAAAQISFDSDNRSTRIRCVMLVQQVLFWAFLGTLAQFGSFQNEVYWIMAVFCGHYWLIMGLLMIGEAPHVSRRVQRTLPTTIASRSLFSLLMPGPGRGFLFALVMLWSCGFVLAFITHFQAELFFDLSQSRMVGPAPNSWTGGQLLQMYAGICASCFYPTFFLSLMYLLVRWRLHAGRMELASGVGPVISLLTGVALVALVTIGSLILHYQFTNYDSVSDYSAFSVFNWYWTTYEIAERGGGSQVDWFWIFVITGSAVVFVAVLSASRELLSRPIAIPERVKIDQQKPMIRLPEGESIDEIFGELT